ncbi:stage III sporulation protein AE [Orenia marismortui]|uniref:Stage III sporulation protein AE n=1 Tax=Orenia marismortui TaxID=46469 RepID=A0A4R8GNE1_9FIRM|nr:stage III sporulation protein AE [Orenia marismortui]TDX43553.1 stage III sporulation protein AE [Orenia marismortui]
MKKLLLSILIICVISSFVYAQDSESDLALKPGDIIERKLEKLNLSELEEEVNKLNKEVDGYLPNISVKDIISLFSRDGFRVKMIEIVRGILRYLLDEIWSNSKLLGQLIVLSIIVAVLKTFQTEDSYEVNNLANGVVYLVLVILALNSFKVAAGIGRDTIRYMVDIMHAILPVLLSLLVSMGNLTSAALFHPISFLIVNSLSTLVINVVFPLIFLSTVLDIVNNISDNFKVTGLASLFKQVLGGVLGFVTTIFLATIVTQGTVATVSDGVTIRTAKYLTGSFIPVVGGFLSSTLDMVVGGSLLIKNALGLFSVLVILVFCSFSVIKILALVFIYRLAGAIIQPITDSKIVDCLNRLSGNLLWIFGSVTVVGVMFFMVIIIMVGTANFTVMMR